MKIGKIVWLSIMLFTVFGSALFAQNRVTIDEAVSIAANEINERLTQVQRLLFLTLIPHHKSFQIIW